MIEVQERNFHYWVSTSVCIVHSFLALPLDWRQWLGFTNFSFSGSGTTHLGVLLSVFPPGRHRHLPPSLAELKWSLFVLFYPAKQQDIASRLSDERIHHYRLTCSAGEGPTVSYQIPRGWEWSEVVSHMKAWTSVLLWGVFFPCTFIFLPHITRLTHWIRTWMRSQEAGMRPSLSHGHLLEC